MNSYRLKQNAKNLLVWALLALAGYSGYQLYRVGAFRHGMRSFRPATARVFGSWPVVGKPIRKWAYGSKKAWKRGRGAVSRRHKAYRRKSRRGRRR